MTHNHFFVDIHSVYHQSAERSPEYLSALYQDKPKLLALITKTVDAHIDKNSITGKRILLKPNWVLHNRKQSDELCMRTHDNFVLTALEYFLKFNPKKVTIGDAPIQGCNWDKIIKPEFEEQIYHLSEKYNIPVSIKDFRRRTFDPSKNNPDIERNPLSDYVIFDLGKESFLEPITRDDKQLFRVTNYNPDRFTESHAPGMHKYCITKELFEADTVISLPKVKTHQKAGITAALKNIVGLNGDKDYLPHHRLGGTGFGGDCYPGKNYLRYWSELVLDFANRRQGKFAYWFGYKLSSLLWRLSFPNNEQHIAAAWHGNDTTWRMVLDLNQIITYGLVDGTVSDKPQRFLYSLCDGIIGGQGDGPLQPDPLPLGIMTFTNNSAMNDIALATLMNFDIQRIPMLKVSLKQLGSSLPQIFFNGKLTDWQSLKSEAVSTTPPLGWIKSLGI